VQKLSNRDIERIIKQWKKGKQISKIANYFGITRQRLYKLIKEYTNSGTFPILRKQDERGKKSQKRLEF
jgi:transposase